VRLSHGRLHLMGSWWKKNYGENFAFLLLGIYIDIDMV
jgi:hypothetical protein